jgi:hypothetical protein
VWRGTITVTRALDLAELLHTTPRSRYRAALLRDPRWLDWSGQSAILADLVDALKENTVSMIQLMGGQANAKPYPRPKRGGEPPAQKIADFPIRELVNMTS